ncbi:MAG: hypothetical protein ABW321_35160, partial [Polyangiales bacterium]
MMTLFKKSTLPGLSLSACLALSGFAAGCGDDDEPPHDEEPAAGRGGSSAAGRGGSSPSDEGGRSGSSSESGRGGSNAGGAGGSGGSSGMEEECDPTATDEVNVDADITEDTTWECGTYLLQKIVYVTEGATLTIKPGVQVLGDTDQSGVVTALIVTRGAKLDAVGTPTQPIVFSSGNPEGARQPGDWGGVVLLGAATINTGTCEEADDDACTGGFFQSNVEGLDPTDPKSLFGGTDDEHNCGSLEYARIEFAGFQLSMDNELNGLTVAACGSETKLNHIQVHRGSDDGIEFFGGTAGLDHF